MAVHLLFLFLLTGLTGVHSVTTVSKVSVKAGASVSIPCLYGSRFINNVKYLCQGYYWDFCSHVVQTNKRNSKKFSISDDKSQRIFTVTIKDLADTDKNYWCIVEVNGGSDVGEYFQLSVTKGTPSLYVDNQSITGFQGGETTISCHYRNSGETKWCRLGGTCVTSPSGSFYGSAVTINASVPNVFTVTMSGLSTESSGWYLCVSGDLQMPVHLTVDKQATTKAPPSTTQRNKSGSVDLKPFIIPLGLLILVVMLTLFILCMLKRHKQSKDESSATATAKEEVTYSVKKKRKIPAQAQEDVTYSDVKHKRKTPAQRMDAKSDEDVTYSSVVIVEQQTKASSFKEVKCSSVWRIKKSLHFLLILTGLTGVHSVTAVSKVSVKAGASISIPCLYGPQYINNEKYLCEGYYWDHCSRVVQTNRRNSGKFSISDDKSQRIFTVTIKDLADTDKNYWCIVDVHGGSDVGEYFQLSVTKGTPSLYVDHQTITGFQGGETTISCHYRNSGETKWCRLGGTCVTSPSGSLYGSAVTINASVPNVFTVTMSGLSTESSGWYLCVSGGLHMPVHVTVDKQATTTVFADTHPITVQHRESPPDHLKIFGIRLAVLIFVVMVTSFALFLYKRHKQTNKESSATTTVKYEGSHVESEVEQ